MVIIVLHSMLGVLAVIYALRHRADLPYAQMVCYVVITDLIRWGFLLLLPWQEVFLFPVLDLIWVSHYGAHTWMARRTLEVDKSRVSSVLIVIHGTATAAISVNYVKNRRWMGRFSFRHSWIRFSAAVLLCLAFRRLVKAVKDGDRCFGVGLGLASTVLSMLQILHHPTESGYYLYQAVLFCYLVFGILVFGKHLFKESINA
jgi:hypothetical protein